MEYKISDHKPVSALLAIKASASADMDVKTNTRQFFKPNFMHNDFYDDFFADAGKDIDKATCS